MYQATKSVARERFRTPGSTPRHKTGPTVEHREMMDARAPAMSVLPRVTSGTPARKMGGPALWTGHLRFLLEHFQERKMVQWMFAYLGGTWLILQAMDVLSDIWGWSLMAQKSVCLTLALGLLPAVVVAWCHGEKGRQRMTSLEILVLVGLFLGSGVVLWRACSSGSGVFPNDTAVEVVANGSADANVVSESHLAECVRVLGKNP